MLLIGMPAPVFALAGTKPREENRKRLRLVQAFFAHAEAPQVLRRASLVLQLSGGVEALTATMPKPGERPVLVALASGEAATIVVRRVRRLLGALHHDPALESGPAIATLLATGADLIARFEVFSLYPFRVCFMCRVWFPGTWYRNVEHFLRQPEADLDVCLLYTSPSPRDKRQSRMPSSA